MFEFLTALHVIFQVIPSSQEAEEVNVEGHLNPSVLGLKMSMGLLTFPEPMTGEIFTSTPPQRPRLYNIDDSKDYIFPDELG
jgi:hypothetical protein